MSGKTPFLRIFSMFLQNLYTWKPFRAVAAAMLVLVMATACQETAQVINRTNSGNTQTVVDNQSSHKKMSEDEQTLVQEFVDNSDMQFLVDANRKMLVKMKIAISNDREGFKQALENKDSKAVIRALNFSESEFMEFAKQRVLASQRLQTKFGSKKDRILALRQKYVSSSMQECTACTGDDFTKNIDERLNKIQSVNLPPTVSELRAMAANLKQGANVQACVGWDWVLLGLAEIGCGLVTAACIGTDLAAIIASGGLYLLTPVQVWHLAGCIALAAACTAAAYCGICHTCQ
jgi:hypothetical protein